MKKLFTLLFTLFTIFAFSQEKERKEVDIYASFIFISENGDVIRNNKIRKLQINKYGYNIVSLSINGKGKTFLVHRMVAECYLSNPNNYPEIDHLDFNKLNNHYSNLEWVTTQENTKRARQANRQIYRNQYSKKL